MDLRRLADENGGTFREKRYDGPLTFPAAERKRPPLWQSSEMQQVMTIGGQADILSIMLQEEEGQVESWLEEPGGVSVGGSGAARRLMERVLGHFGQVELGSCAKAHAGLSRLPQQSRPLGRGPLLATAARLFDPRAFGGRRATDKRRGDDALQKHAGQTDEQPWRATALDRAAWIAAEAGFVNCVRRTTTPVHLEGVRHMMAEDWLQEARTCTERQTHVRYDALPSIGTASRIDAPTGQKP